MDENYINIIEDDSYVYAHSQALRAWLLEEDRAGTGTANQVRYVISWLQCDLPPELQLYLSSSKDWQWHGKVEAQGMSFTTFR